MSPLQKAILTEASLNVTSDPIYAKELLNEVLAMDITFGEDGLDKSWQQKFPETVKCVHCEGEARIAFVAHEGIDTKLPYEEYLSSMHKNDPKGEGYWLHDCAAFAIYLCQDCLEPTAKYNQA